MTESAKAHHGSLDRASLLLSNRNTCSRFPSSVSSIRLSLPVSNLHMNLVLTGLASLTGHKPAQLSLSSQTSAAYTLRTQEMCRSWSLA